jgi:hypothetical protein
MSFPQRPPHPPLCASILGRVGAGPRHHRGAPSFQCVGPLSSPAGLCLASPNGSECPTGIALKTAGAWPASEPSPKAQSQVGGKSRPLAWETPVWRADPLYRIRKLLLKGRERLDERGNDHLLLGLRLGDPHDELLGAWLAKESVRDVYLTSDPKEAALLLDKAIAGCRMDPVPEIRTLGRTLARWRTEILNHHTTGASNGPTEGNNFCVKQVKRAGRGFTSFEHYRLRVLLHTGGVRWAQRPSPPRIRTRSPHSDA